METLSPNALTTAAPTGVRSRDGPPLPVGRVCQLCASQVLHLLPPLGVIHVRLCLCCRSTVHHLQLHIYNGFDFTDLAFACQAMLVADRTAFRDDDMAAHHPLPDKPNNNQPLDSR